MTATPFVDRTGDDDTTWQAELARIEAATACDEGAVETVARALATADGWPDVFWESDLYSLVQEHLRATATVAISAMKPAVTR